MTEALFDPLMAWFPVIYLLVLGMIALIWTLIALLLFLQVVRLLQGEPTQAHKQQHRSRRSLRSAQYTLQSQQSREWQKHIPSYITPN
jgi:hypothetical protein